jgi:hypothetical protein
MRGKKGTCPSAMVEPIAPAPCNWASGPCWSCEPGCGTSPWATGSCSMVAGGGLAGAVGCAARARRLRRRDHRDVRFGRRGHAGGIARGFAYGCTGRSCGGWPGRQTWWTDVVDRSGAAVALIITRPVAPAQHSIKHAARSKARVAPHAAPAQPALRTAPPLRHKRAHPACTHVPNVS